MKSGFAVLFSRTTYKAVAGVNLPVPLRTQRSSFLSIHLYVPFVQGSYKVKTSSGALSRDFAGGHDASDDFFH